MLKFQDIQELKILGRNKEKSGEKNIGIDFSVWCELKTKVESV